ncbi:MAG: hypothetical protein FWF31_00320 [Desulfobulbus sp.]|nr:hypothetical protein [Desulfobulbus sp.]
MAEQPKRNWKIWALIAVLVVAAGGGYFANEMYKEKKMAADIERKIAADIERKKIIADIEQTLANLPGGFALTAENIKVDDSLNSVVLTKITGSGTVAGETITVSVDSAEGKGLNLRAFKEKGVTSLADSLALRNMKIAGQDLELSVGLYQLEKVQGDFVAIAEQSAKLWAIAKAGTAADAAKDSEGSKKVFDDLLAAMLNGGWDALASFRIGKARVEKYAVTIKGSAAHPELPGIALRMDSSEATDYSATHYGPAFARGLAMEMNGKPLVSLEEMSLKNMDMPELKELMKMSAEPKPSFKNLKMSLQDLRLKKLNITMPIKEGQGALTPDDVNVSMDDFNFSFSLDKGSGALGLKVDRLDMPTLLLTKGNLMALLFLGMDHLPKRTLLSNDLDIFVTDKGNEVFDLLIKKENFSIKDMGAIAFSGDLLDIDAGGGGIEPQVRKLDLAVTDNGFVKIGLAVNAMNKGGSDDVEAQRASLVSQLEAARDMLPNQTLKDVNIALTEFIKQPGGAIRVAMAPENPVSARAVQQLIMTDTAKLGISSSFTPKK